MSELFQKKSAERIFSELNEELLFENIYNNSRVRDEISVRMGLDRSITTYNLFSLKKNNLKLNEAREGFLNLLNVTYISKDIISGIFFHLGEIEQLSGNHKKAIEYFDLSLKSNIDHKKSRIELECSLKLLKAPLFDVLLISVEQGPMLIPFSILSLASYLDQFGYKTLVVDNSYSESEILKLSVLTKGFVGFSVTTPQIKPSLKLTKKIKYLSSKTTIIWGGAHPTLYPEQTIACKEIDIAVIGDGEYVLGNILNGKKKEEIEGIIFKDGEKIIKNKGESKQFNIGDLKKYNFDIINAFPYLNLNYKGKYLPLPSISYLSSRECPMKCSFCMNSYSKLKKNWNGRSASVMVEDIKMLKNKFNLRSFLFSDPNLFFNYKRMEEFCSEMIVQKMDIVWGGSIHANNILKHKDIIAGAVKSGFKLSLCGVESGCDRILKILNKQIVMDQVFEVAHFLAKMKIEGHYFFMYDLPGETNEEIKKTIDVMYKIKDIYFKEKTDISFSFDRYLPIPGTRLYESAIKNGHQEPLTLEDWK